MSSNAGLAAPYVREQGHLMLGLLNTVAGGRLEAALADETSAATS